MRREFRIETKRGSHLVDITASVQALVRESGVASGVAHVFVTHTTAGLTINENADPSVRGDLVAALERAVPDDIRYSHTEGNSPAHVKASLMGFCQTILIEGGALMLGTWQGLYLCEFDGPRTRRVVVKIQPDAR